ncbi:hypothetical protein KU43P_29750 [Pseudomonas sp. KU43P]|nr:hypothetical protein KU43P_29750 [Pseudomonas sp. KU43P]
MRNYRHELKFTIKETEREALILVPIKTSAQGNELNLDWEGRNGHVRLKTVKDGGTTLLRAVHNTWPVLKGQYTSNFTFWPDTPEAYTITLNIENCLLREMTRHDSGSRVDQRVQFGYAPTLLHDHVLCSVSEENGSLEVVTYDQHEIDRYPRVKHHVVIPGSQQPTRQHTWGWSFTRKDYSLISSSRVEYSALGPASGQAHFTQWKWFKNSDKAHLLERLIEEVPGEQRRTTEFRYNSEATSTDSVLARQLRAQQIEQRVTVEALNTPSPTEELQ